MPGQHRVLVLSYDDDVSRAVLDAAAIPLDEVWQVGAQGPIAGAFRNLPRDERSVARAMTTRRPVGGALGASYDALAELLAIDAS